ncbi:MAG TPA: sigma-70 family RNA polymerase sigma factor [Terriglobia bacterium]|nr:sigma-70 family RNA polymerase sigma factor [Terriglobia bacterium]
MFFKSTAGLEGFEAAAMPHLAALYRTAKFLVHNPAEAEDLVQDVYLEALKSFHRFEQGTNCKAWLFRILFHRLHHLRRRLLKSSLEDTFTDQDTMAAEPPVPEEIKDEDILAALDKVPLAFREVVVMADVEEFSYKEIAEALKLPVGTVMSRLSRGRKLLREELAGVAKSYGIGTSANDATTGETA